MNTMGIALKVQPGAKLTIRAPTVMMKRREASAHQHEQVETTSTILLKTYPIVYFVANNFWCRFKNVYSLRFIVFLSAVNFNEGNLPPPCARARRCCPISNIVRRKMDDQPILRAFGSIHFEVTRWLPEHLDGTLMDKHGVVAFEGQGSLESRTTIRFTATSVVVADPAAADQRKIQKATSHLHLAITSWRARSLDKNMLQESCPCTAVRMTKSLTPSFSLYPPPTLHAHRNNQLQKEADLTASSMPTDPELRRKLDIRHAKSNRERDSAAATAATVGEVADEKSSSSVTTPSRAAVVSTVVAAAPDDSDDGDKTAPASEATLASSTATATPATPATGTAADPSTRADVGTNPASGASMAEFMTGKARHARTVNDHGKKAVADGGGEGSSPIPASNSWTTKKKARQHRQQQQQQEEDRRHSKRNGTGGNNNSNGDSSNNNNNNNSNRNRNGNSFSPPNEFHDENVLRAERFLFGKLVSPGKKAMIYVSPNSGSVVHAASVGRVPRDEEGREIGPVPQKLMTVLTPNEQQMSKIERNRSEIWAQRLERSKALREGRELKRSKVAAIMSALPFGKNGFRRRRAREHAEAHLMEATLKLTNRGTLVRWREAKGLEPWSVRGFW
ncbi:unnamed protein product [Ectocarpus sp. CCAP 1310/34]|nr:unnamed protein product [Ectocarpus sp. CCAP 1310/34]